MEESPPWGYLHSPLERRKVTVTGLRVGVVSYYDIPALCTITFVTFQGKALCVPYSD